MRTSGTWASNAVKFFLLSLMQPAQDFFMSMIILEDSVYEEFGLYVAEGLEDVSAMSHFRMCIPHNTFGQDGFLADQRDSDSGPETVIRDVIHSIQRLDDEVFVLVGGDDSFRCICETLNDEEED